jgi:ATP-dependent Lhr-like helicase
VQKNLQQPLLEIGQAALAAGLLVPDLRVVVRTGDTPMTERQQMLRRPPHILITTPESLFILLTADKSRAMLKTVRTVIVDEVHAVAPNKRGAHLALSLERVSALAGGVLQRIGLSATQRPIERMGHFLVGNRRSSLPKPEGDPTGDCPNDVTIIDVGHRRDMDLAVEVPKDELGPVATNAIWSDIYDRVAALVESHRSTLVFVNTRRLAERVSHYLEDRLRHLGEGVVAAHHGSLSREIRLSGRDGVAGTGHRCRDGRSRLPDRLAPVHRDLFATCRPCRSLGSCDSERPSLRHHAGRIDGMRRADPLDQSRGLGPHRGAARSAGRPRATDRRSGCRPGLG